MKIEAMNSEGEITTIVIMIMILMTMARRKQYIKLILITETLKIFFMTQFLPFGPVLSTEPALS
jgi:hypothetical protein